MNEEFSSLEADRPGAASVSIQRVERAAAKSVLPTTMDLLAIEEPLEIRLESGPDSNRMKRSISITMRTPGYDFELAVGFLFTEGIVKSASDIRRVAYCGPELSKQPLTNIVRVELAPHVKIDMERLSRHFYTSSSCGVCGKSSIEALKTQSQFSSLDSKVCFEGDRIHDLPRILRQSQQLFDSTGGLHASALFSERGDPLLVREDVGRHNALDKVIGHALLRGLLPLHGFVLLVSGRASFELIQKASMAGIGVFAAVGAPSSLAVELAQETGMTLLGFVRGDRFNIYSHPFRVRVAL